MPNGESSVRVVGLASVVIAAVIALEPGRGAAARPARTGHVSTAAAHASPPRPTADSARLKAALDAARRCDAGAARRYQAKLADPVARKIVDWAFVDVMADRMFAPELESAISHLQGWPRAEARERALDRAQLGRPERSVPCGGVRRSEDKAAEAFKQQRLQMYAALRRGDARSAYAAVTRHGQSPGSLEYAEAEALAGWLALDKLHDPTRAERHFARLDAAVRSPVSKARAAYWRGRTAERSGDASVAQKFYEQGAVYSTTFYGQLAAQKAGRQELVLTPDPRPSANDRASFKSAEMTRALRLLASANERGLLRVFALKYGEEVESEAELALLVDELRALDEQELSLLAYRRGAQHGLILHERGYPLVRTPSVPAGAERAWVLAITRQESQFDPRVRSPAGALGMMQLLPETGRRVARRAGMSWSDGLLWDARANMRLGSRYLGELTEAFDGSYLLAAASYDAGPQRLPDWIALCGDPRSPKTDPLDFIECIPISETRDYVMNVMANYQVYRARLNGGRARLTAVEALRAVRRP
jgi:soluble lytic murein transglycosylase